ncbi:MAG: SDR family oxidoreductase [Nitrospinae bacterium]|nr:SDR family oxidoreductase [Nitrospinota bacterium]
MKYVLIIGARSDLGREIARLFAGNGFGVYLAARQSAGLAAECEHLKIRYGVQAKTVECDLRDFSSHAPLYGSLHPKPEGAVCVVGYLGSEDKAKTDFTEARQIMETNFVGCVSILNAVAEDFEKRGEGFIIGVSSVAGDRGRRKTCIYGSAKAGFTAYLSGLRNRLHRHGVRVLTVKPGWMDTKMTEGMNLPPLFTAQPEDAARDVFRAWQKGKDVVYTKWMWRYIMWVIVHIPERIFKKMDL